MSMKYNEHPMEQKAREDIEANKLQRREIDAAFSLWNNWWYQSNADKPTLHAAFMAGWIEHKEEIRRAEENASRAAKARE